ncbi:MAG: hypothetical protein ACOH1Y_01910 [Propionicimonas sp.]
MRQDLVEELKAFDPLGGRGPQVEREAIDDLLDGVLRTPRPLGQVHTTRWLGALAAAAAVITAAVLIWPGNSAQRVTAVPAASPSPAPAAGTWARTAAPPLSPRHYSVTAWIGGAFYVIGGLPGAPCPASADCVEQASPLRDGARYDPATDGWTPIAPAPIGLVHAIGPANPYPLDAVLNSRLYVVSGTSMVLYDPAADLWLDGPALDDAPISLHAGATTLVALLGPSENNLNYAHFEPGRGAIEPGRGRVGMWLYHHFVSPTTVHGLAVFGDELVVSSLTADGMTVTIMNALTSQRRVTLTVPAGLQGQRPSPVALVTGGEAWAVFPRGDTSAWFLRLSDRTWSSVKLPDTPGTFVAQAADPLLTWYVTPSGMVAIQGHLYDPRTRRWSATPALPVPAEGAVVASGEDSVLACFGYDAERSSQNDSCYLLRPSPATLPTPGP